MKNLWQRFSCISFLFKSPWYNHSFISNPVLVLHESVRMWNQNYKRNTVVSHKSQRPPICTTEKYLKSHVHQQRVVSGVASYASATKFKNENVCTIGESHLKRINERKFRKELGKRFIYFKCFSGVNTKLLNYHVVPTLVDETPQTVVIYISWTTKQGTFKILHKK